VSATALGVGGRRDAWVAWAVALPVLVLALGMVALPFLWRSFAALLACGREAGCGVLTEAYYLDALRNTVLLSLASTMLALPPALAAALAAQRSPRWRSLATLAGSLGANFAGVPLALAFTLMFGVQGSFSVLAGAQILEPSSSLGLLVAFVCFQMPLACLLLLEPVRLLDAHLQEAAATLGASDARYWRTVALPLLAPSLVEVAVLLFANGAAAYATPFALAGSGANVLAVRITALVSGDLFADPRLSALLALLLFALLAVTLGLGRLLVRWLARRVA
jgi:putative spermidine/putrescine transport system permease protein